MKEDLSMLTELSIESNLHQPNNIKTITEKLETIQQLYVTKEKKTRNDVFENLRKINNSVRKRKDVF